jgi:hypothetical protein
MTGRRIYRAHRRTAWLAVFALLLQSLIPAFHHPASMAFAGTLAFGDVKDLCLASGSAPVAPGDHDKAPQHHVPDCPICQAVHAMGGFPPPTAPVVALPGEAGTGTPTVRTALLVRQRAFTLAQPRGPPASI